MTENVMPATSTHVVKNRKGKIVSTGQRIMAYNVYLKHKNEGMSKTKAVEHASVAVGIGRRTMFNIVGDMETTGICKSPKKNNERDDMYAKMSEDEKNAVRRCVHFFFKRNEIATLDKVLQATKENEFIPSMGRTTLFNVLKKLGFAWEKRGRHSMIIDRNDIILRRRRKLTKMKK